MSVSLKTLKFFLTEIDSQPFIFQAKTELSSLKTLNQRVQELAKQFSQHPQDLDRDAIDSIEKLRILSINPSLNPSARELFQKLYRPFLSAEFDQSLESLKKKIPEITLKEISDLFDLKDQLLPSQLGILAHTFSQLTELKNADKEFSLFLNTSLADLLQQLRKTPITTLTEFQTEVKAIQKKSYLSEEEKKIIASILNSPEIRNNAFDEILEKETLFLPLFPQKNSLAPTIVQTFMNSIGSFLYSKTKKGENYQLIKNLLKEASFPATTIQGNLWTHTMIQSLIEEHPALEQLQDEFKKELSIEFANHDSLKLNSYERSLFTDSSPIFRSLWMGNLKEAYEWSITGISKKAFGQILQDLKNLFCEDGTTLLERALFCKKYQLAALAAKYEDELCYLAKEVSIEEILKLMAYSSKLEKLKAVCLTRINSYLLEAINTTDPKVLLERLDFLKPYSSRINTLDFNNCSLSSKQLETIVERLPHLSSLSLFPDASVKNHQILIDLLKKMSLPSMIIQDNLWTSSMLNLLVNAHPTFEAFQKEIKKEISIKFLDNESLELNSHDKYLLMEHSPVFRSLWMDGFKEAHAEKITMNTISASAFHLILQDLNQKHLFCKDPATLLERAIFCKEYELTLLTDNYEQELYHLSEKKSLQEILELDSYASDLEKLENLFQTRINSYLVNAIQTLNPQVFQNALELLSFYTLAIDTLDFTECTLSSEQLKQIVQRLPNLTSLKLGNQVKDNHLEVLTSLSKLTSLSLSKCNKITDSGVSYLGEINHLMTLNLSWCTNLTEASLGYLSKLEQLTSLNMSGCFRITNESLKYLSKLRNLKVLDLSWCPTIANPGLNYLAELTGLVSLNFSGCKKVVKGGFTCLSQLTNLTSLNLSSSDITDPDLKDLLELAHLNFLDLSNCPLTDESFNYLSKFNHLTSLDLRGCDNITEIGLKNFSKTVNLARLYWSWYT